MSKTEYERMLKAIKSEYAQKCDEAKEALDEKMSALAILFPEYGDKSEPGFNETHRMRIDVDAAIEVFLSGGAIHGLSFTAQDVIKHLKDTTGLLATRSSMSKALERNVKSGKVILVHPGKGRNPSHYGKPIDGEARASA